MAQVAKKRPQGGGRSLGPCRTESCGLLLDEPDNVPGTQGGKFHWTMVEALGQEAFDKGAILDQRFLRECPLLSQVGSECANGLLDRCGFPMLDQWAYDAQLAQQIHEPLQGGKLATADRLLSCRILEETPRVLVSHVPGSNFFGLKPFAEVRRQPNLPAEKVPLETLFVEEPRERIKIRYKRTFGVMQQDPQSFDNLVHLDSPPRNDGWGEKCYAEQNGANIMFNLGMRHNSA
jgi:hypothetical protein